MTSWRDLHRQTRERVGDPVARWLCEEASGDVDGHESVPGETASPRMVAHLDRMAERYLAGEPLAYVLGHWSFRHLDLAVDRRVLIPRPETEVVAGVAIELASTLPRPLTVADLGTGSGAIGLALADELPLDGVTVWLTDVDEDAIDIARANLAGLGRRGRNVRIAAGSWFDALPAGTTLDLVVSNPPYIADDSPDVEQPSGSGSQRRRCSPGGTGSTPSGRSSTTPRGGCALEVGSFSRSAPTRVAVLPACSRAAGYRSVEVRPDLAGRDRVAIAEVP